MWHWEMTWRTAAYAGLVLALPSLLWRPTRRSLALVVAGARECGLVIGLFGLWQYVGGLAKTDHTGAIAHAQWLWDAERVLRLPNEVDVEHLISGHAILAHLSDAYYIYAHFNGLIALLIWVWVWHRDRYPETRNLVVLFTGASLFVQLIPVAPPRLTPGHGVIDVAAVYGESVYHNRIGGIAAEVSAMPSIHVGWALLVAFIVIRVGTSPWRWLVLLHPALTTFVVVATGNHFWLDGVGAAALLVLAFAGERGLAAAYERVRVHLWTRTAPEAVPLPAMTRAE